MGVFVVEYVSPISFFFVIEVQVMYNIIQIIGM